MLYRLRPVVSTMSRTCDRPSRLGRLLNDTLGGGLHGRPRPVGEDAAGRVIRVLLSHLSPSAVDRKALLFAAPGRAGWWAWCRSTAVDRRGLRAATPTAPGGGLDRGTRIV